MAGLLPADLLAACERARGLHPIDRALSLAAAAAPAEEVAALPLAELDRRLLALRAALLGDRLDCLAACPACGAALEFALSAAAIAARLTSPPPERLTTEDGWEIALRPLDSRDLAAAARAPDRVAAEAVLAARAVAALRPPAPLDPACPPPEPVRAAATARAAARETEGVVELALDCAACGAAWQAPLDIGGHVWAEAEALAGRLLAEVAALAARYGWSEAAILGMSPARRNAYLALGA
jgi:hypothetical protein